MIPEDEEPTSRNPHDELLRWHYRMGHLPFDQIKQLVQTGQLPKRLLTVKKPFCAAWLAVPYWHSYHKTWRISTRECTSIFGFGSYPPKFTYEIPSKFHLRFPPILVPHATQFPSFISLCHKISESSDINQDVR